MAVAVRALALVAAGGTVGTLLRTLAVTGEGDGLPLQTLAVNVAGAFLLGLLLGALHRRPQARSLRLALGTGLLGAFTTWSGLAVQCVLLVRDGRATLAAGYLLASLTLGVLAAAAGSRLGAGTSLGRKTS